MMSSVLQFLLVLWVAHRRASTAEGEGCTLSTDWSGAWLDGRTKGIWEISNDGIDVKGRCFTRSDDLVLLENRRNGGQADYWCFVFKKFHDNFIKYKEFLLSRTPSLREPIHTICAEIAHSTFYPLFRKNIPPQPCPFERPMTFTYRKSGGQCSSRSSAGSVCATDTQYQFDFTACPNMPETQREAQTIECYGTYGDGGGQSPVRHFIGKVVRVSRGRTHEDDYRCFMFDSKSILISATSDCLELRSFGGDAGVKIEYVQNALPFDLALAQKHLAKACTSAPSCDGFPRHLRGQHGGKRRAWDSVDKVDQRWTFEKESFEVREIASNTRVAVGYYVDEKVSKESHVKVFTIWVLDRCQSGYQCLRIHRHDSMTARQVTELQRGKIVSDPELACLPQNIPNTTLHETLLLQNSVERPCPYKPSRFVRMCSSDRAAISFGCDDVHRLTVDYRCDKPYAQDVYNCHGYWTLADGTGFLVGKEKTSGKKACFIYRKDDSTLHLSALYQTSCRRSFRPGIAGHRVIFANANASSELCSPVSSAYSRGSGQFPHSRSLRFAFAHLLSWILLYSMLLSSLLCVF